jgi:beta-glucosidase
VARRLLDPLVFGEYPVEMRSILGNQLPRISTKEKSLLRGSLDFIGINNYGALYAKDCYLSTCPPEAARPIRGFLETTGMRDGIPIGDQVLTCSPNALVIMLYCYNLQVICQLIFDNGFF